MYMNRYACAYRYVHSIYTLANKQVNYTCIHGHTHIHVCTYEIKLKFLGVKLYHSGTIVKFTL